MNERSATIRPARLEVAGSEVADVRSLADVDPGIGPEGPVELPVADVDRENGRGPRAEEERR